MEINVKTFLISTFPIFQVLIAYDFIVRTYFASIPLLNTVIYNVTHEVMYGIFNTNLFLCYFFIKFYPKIWLRWPVFVVRFYDNSAVAFFFGATCVYWYVCFCLIFKRFGLVWCERDEFALTAMHAYLLLEVDSGESKSAQACVSIARTHSSHNSSFSPTCGNNASQQLAGLPSKWAYVAKKILQLR